PHAGPGAKPAVSGPGGKGRACRAAPPRQPPNQAARWSVGVEVTVEQAAAEPDQRAVDAAARCTVCIRPAGARVSALSVPSILAVALSAGCPKVAPVAGSEVSEVIDPGWARALGPGAGRS